MFEGDDLKGLNCFISILGNVQLSKGRAFCARDGGGMNNWALKWGEHGFWTFLLLTFVFSFQS